MASSGMTIATVRTVAGALANALMCCGVDLMHGDMPSDPAQALCHVAIR